jgi:hypothetical protein
MVGTNRSYYSTVNAAAAAAADDEHEQHHLGLCLLVPVNLYEYQKEGRRRGQRA